MKVAQATGQAPEPRSTRDQVGVGRGMGLLAGARISAQVMQFGSSIWLARLLTPSDYGVFAIIMTVSMFALLLNDFGLTEALVRQPVLARWHADGALWVNGISGVVLFVVFSLASPVLAQIFDEPRLVYLFPLASLTFVISTNVVQIAILQRHRRFGFLAAAEVANSLTLMVVTTVLALVGAGVLSLVIGLLAGTTVMTLMLWSEVHWVPGRPRRADMITMLRGSAGNLSYSGLGLVGNSVDTYTVGIISSTAALGAYNRAYNLSRTPSSFVGGVLNRVLLPVYADLRERPGLLAQTWVTYTRRTLILLCPVAAFISLFASPLVNLLYGSRWAASGTYLAVLAWVIPAFAFASNVGPFLFLLARQRTVFVVGAAQAAIFVTIVIGAAFGGVSGVVWGVLAAGYLGHLPLIWVCLRSARIPMASVRAALIAPILATLLLTVALVGARAALADDASLMVGLACLAVAACLAVIVTEPKARERLSRYSLSRLPRSRPRR